MLRLIMLTVVLVASLVACSTFESTLSPSHGLSADLRGGSQRWKRGDSRDLTRVEVVVDAPNAGIKDEITRAIASRFNTCSSIKQVQENSDLVLRAVVTSDHEAGFERQEPVRITMLVIPTSDDDPPRLSRLESEAVMEANFACLRAQAPELCGMFVGYVDIATRMESEMKEDAEGKSS